MIMSWSELVGALGQTKNDNIFTRLLSKLKELPVYEEGVLGDRSYYSFFRSGILFLIENEKIDQISFYLKSEEGFSRYSGELPVLPAQSKEDVIQQLGPPSASGGGKTDKLLGYINSWIKYERDGYALHLQFDQNDKLSRVTIMQ